MSLTVSEADWKVFRRLRAIALERFCQRVLDELTRLAADTERSTHERYLSIFTLIQRRDDEIAAAFNNPRRSVAFLQLATIHSLGLLTDDELADFSPETRERLAGWLGR